MASTRATDMKVAGSSSRTSNNKVASNWPSHEAASNPIPIPTTDHNIPVRTIRRTTCGGVAPMAIRTLISSVFCSTTYDTTPYTPTAASNNASMANTAVSVVVVRSEEHTSELQSQSNLVCRLLLEK